jgi:hypothetical protein
VEEFDWGEPSKEELVLEARLAERDEVPEWARALTLGGKPVQVRPFQGRELPAYLLEDAFDLTKANMEEMYLRSIWGWSEAQKRSDLESPLARLFVATDERGHLQGFIHYRFELIDNKFTHEISAAACVCSRVRMCVRAFVRVCLQVHMSRCKMVACSCICPAFFLPPLKKTCANWNNRKDTRPGGTPLNRA